MFWLSIKKSFFDAWDNLGILILGNLTIAAILIAGLWPMLKIAESGSAWGLVFLAAAVPMLFIAGGTVSSLLSVIADFRRPAWTDLPGILKKTWSASLFLCLVVVVFFTVSGFGMMYYSKIGNILGLAAMAFLFWLSVAAYLAALWYFPVRNRLSGTPLKSFKKCMLIMADNLGLSLFAGFILVPIQLILWPITAFGAFGPAGTLLYMDASLRLLMFKYDWLEENPGAAKKDVPWFELLVEEKERVGKRTLKGMIFPWKD